MLALQGYNTHWLLMRTHPPIEYYINSMLTMYEFLQPCRYLTHTTHAPMRISAYTIYPFHSYGISPYAHPCIHRWVTENTA